MSADAPATRPADAPLLIVGRLGTGTGYRIRAATLAGWRAAGDGSVLLGLWRAGHLADFHAPPPTRGEGTNTARRGPRR